VLIDVFEGVHFASILVLHNSDLETGGSARRSSVYDLGTLCQPTHLAKSALAYTSQKREVEEIYVPIEIHRLDDGWSRLECELGVGKETPSEESE
jgi:hypothetical protein